MNVHVISPSLSPSEIFYPTMRRQQMSVCIYCSGNNLSRKLLQTIYVMIVFYFVDALYLDLHIAYRRSEFLACIRIGFIHCYKIELT